VFINDASFVAAVDKAFRTIVNDTATNAAARSPEVMARYTDTMLRKKQKTGLSEVEIEDRLSRVVSKFESTIGRGWVDREKSGTNGYCLIFIRLSSSNILTIRTSSKSFTPVCWRRDLSLTLPYLRRPRRI